MLDAPNNNGWSDLPNDVVYYIYVGLIVLPFFFFYIWVKKADGNVRVMCKFAPQ